MGMFKGLLTVWIIMAMTDTVCNEVVFFTHNNAIDNKTCQRETLFVNTGVTSIVQCIAMCSANKSCTALFHTPQTGRCQGCATIELLETHAGSLFYVKKTNANDDLCLGQTGNGSHAIAASYAASLLPPICVQKILTVDNGVHLGSWYDAELCPFGTYAVGFDIKVEADRGPFDDSSANAIQLRCQTVDRKFSGGKILSKEGQHGNWWPTVECEQTGVLKSFRLRAERYYTSNSPLIPTDNTAVSYVQFKCAPLFSTMMNVLPARGLFGNLGSWSEQCDVGHGICGLRARVDISEEILVDDTGLNDVVFYCC